MKMICLPKWFVLVCWFSLLMNAWNFARAQDVTPVTKGIDPSGIVLVLSGVALIGGLIVLKRKRPELYAKITRTGATMMHDAEHTISATAPKVFEHAKNAVQGVSEQVHEYAAHAAPLVPPAVALPPSAYVAVPGVPPLTTEQFMGEAPVPQVIDVGAGQTPMPKVASGPKFINGRMVG